VNDSIATTEQLDDAIIYGPGLRWAIMGTCLIDIMKALSKFQVGAGKLIQR
jgi:hypothetical protein